MTAAKKNPAKKQAAKPKPKAKEEQLANATDGFMPAILCAHTKLVPIESLKRHPRNPNTHPDSQIKLLANIIAKSGFRSPIVVSNRSGFITKGHGRLDAAELLGLKAVPVDFQDYESEEMEMADMVADNQIASMAEMDRAVLKDILQELDTGAFDMLLTGFDAAGIEELMTALPPEEDDETYTRKITPPVYEPSAEKPDVTTLVDTAKSEALIAEIDNANLPDEIKEFLRLAARRHDVFNFSFIADFYAHSDDETKALFEKSALVIIDMGKAIENGFVRMSEEIASQYGKDYNTEG